MKTLLYLSLCLYLYLGIPLAYGQCGACNTDDKNAYKQLEKRGAWVYIRQEGKGTKIKPGERLNISYTLCLEQDYKYNQPIKPKVHNRNTLISEKKDMQYTVGNGHFPPKVEDALRHLSKGTNACIRISYKKAHGKRALRNKHNRKFLRKAMVTYNIHISGLDAP